MIAVCGTCDMPHHLSCWQDNQGCTTFGCTGTIKEIIGNTAAATAEQPAGAAEPKPAGKEQSEKPVETLYESGEMVFMADVPLVLENTAIIIDRTKDKVFARCGFRSLTDKPIKAVMIQITCQDVWGSTLGEPTAHQYLDLKTKRDSGFGLTDPIELPDKTTRQIQVAVRKVLFSDNTVINGGDATFTMPAPVLLSAHLGSEALAKEYARETTPKARFLMQSANGYWHCTCGALNTEAETVCHSCGSTPEQLAAAMNPEALNDNMVAFAEKKRAADEQAQAEQAERIRQAEEAVALEQKQHRERIELQQKQENRKSFRKKITIASIISVVIVAALVCATVFWIIPYSDYLAASELLETGQYDAAHQAFLDLNGFINSEAMAQESLYQKGRNLLENGSYVAANQIFVSLGDYEDSEEMAQESLYQKALYEVETENYFGAIQTFQSLGDYKDSADQILETRYLWAIHCQDTENYEGAYRYFSQLGNYKDSKDKLFTTVLLWEAKALGSYYEVDAFKKTVKLDSSHYEMFYNTIMLFINGHTNAREWYDWGATDYSRSVRDLLPMLPDNYKDTAILRELFCVLCEYRPNSYEGLFSENETLMRQCWPLDFVQDLAEDDYAICDFLVGYWTGSGYYFRMDEDHHSYYDLPHNEKPKGTKYYDIDDLIYYYDDSNDNHLAKVYRFTIVDYDTIKVYCYKNNRTYTMYR